jgi:hypothetical protein
MWISNVTFDLVTIRTLPEEDVVAVYYSIQNKKEELRFGGGSDEGAPVEGFEKPPQLINLDPNQTHLTIKRIWSTQAKAQEFADFCDTAADWITGAVEEQP